MRLFLIFAYLYLFVRFRDIENYLSVALEVSLSIDNIDMMVISVIRPKLFIHIFVQLTYAIWLRLIMKFHIKTKVYNGHVYILLKRGI